MAVGTSKFDPYEILGLERNATAGDVKQAYRRKAKETHPDTGGDAKAFADANRAQAILLDPERRERFDRTGDADEVQPDNADQAAMGLISQMIQTLLAGEDDPFSTDIINQMRACIEKDVNQIKAQISKVRKAEGRAKKMLGRFKRRKGEGANAMERMVEWHLEAIGQSIAQAEASLKHRARALEIIADYEFEQDRPQPQPQFVSFIHAGGGFPHTSTGSRFSF